MHFLEKLSDDELLSKIKSLAADERSISVDVLRHLREVEKRRLFAALGYSSLYAYVTQELGYDEGGAVLRISSARLMADIPETEEPLRTGRLNVSTMNQAQRFFRAEKEERGKEYTPQEKRDLLQSIEGCSKLETAQKLAELSPGANHKVRLSLLVTPELMSKLKSLQGLLAHSGADQSFEKLIEMMADQTLKKLEKNFGNAKNTEAKSKANPHTDPANADKKNWEGNRSNQRTTCSGT